MGNGWMDGWMGCLMGGHGWVGCERCVDGGSMIWLGWVALVCFRVLWTDWRREGYTKYDDLQLLHLCVASVSVNVNVDVNILKYSLFGVFVCCGIRGQTSQRSEPGW